MMMSGDGVIASLSQTALSAEALGRLRSELLAHEGEAVGLVLYGGGGVHPVSLTGRLVRVESWVATLLCDQASIAGEPAEAHVPLERVLYAVTASAAASTSARVHVERLEGNGQ